MTTALITIPNIAPILPVTIETRFNKIPILDRIRVIVQAHSFPFHTPWVTTKYAIPNSIRAVLISADENTSILDRSVPTTTAAIPLAINPIPPIMVSIATMVTPRGLLCSCFFIVDVLSLSVLGQVLLADLQYNIVS